jgi:hypothetical protein
MGDQQMGYAVYQITKSGQNHQYAQKSWEILRLTYQNTCENTDHPKEKQRQVITNGLVSKRAVCQELYLFQAKSTLWAIP